MCQGPVQEFSWDTPQVTLHLVIVYYRDGAEDDGSFSCKGFCVVSDRSVPNAVVNNTFIEVIMN